MRLINPWGGKPRCTRRGSAFEGLRPRRVIGSVSQPPPSKATPLHGWGWQGFSAFLEVLEIQVDRNDGKGWTFLTYDTTPNYNDTFPFPATPTKWEYRAIHRVGDAQVGQWSSTQEITVGG